jgi:CheY-like chemotaxis protein
MIKGDVQMVSHEDEIMVVEDEPESRAFLIEILQLEGFRVVAFSNGAEALNHLTISEAPCLVIFDIRMPVMDGPQFRSAMLQIPRLAKIPAVVVTAFEPSAVANLLVLRVFRKPLDVDALLITIRENC